MNTMALVLLGANYLLVMSLPFLFFQRRDRGLSPAWWITAVPFIFLPFAVTLGVLGMPLRLIATDSRVGEGLCEAAILFSAVSIGLVLIALGAHRTPLAQWHQHHDVPSALVTAGPYSRVRHPFYLAYLLMFAAGAACAPGAGTIVTLVYAVAALNFTAAREERQLSQSSFGSEYRAYIACTGRFFPSLSGRPK